MSGVIVVGGGAAGMMAAVSAAESGAPVTLLEQNEKLGKKIYITGKGRGNLTNASDISDFFDCVISNPSFLYSALYSFDNNAVMDFFKNNGIRLKEERGNRVFPKSDHASDITKALSSALKNNGVDIRLNSRVEKLLVSERSVYGVELSDGSKLQSDLVIVATGGCSYQTTGSRGDGYRFAEDLGINVVEPVPALVPMISPDDYIKRLQGLSLKNVTLSFYENDRQLYSSFGEMLFTHAGISGPLVLTASSFLTRTLKAVTVLDAAVDLKPAITEKELDARLIKIISDSPRKSFKHFYDGLVPKKLTSVLVDLTGIDPGKQYAGITKAERKSIVKLLKAFPFRVSSTADFNEAIITQGGVDVLELDPSTMRSKKYKGLAFAGEVIDVDAKTGGYNMQIAFSTGHLAGENCRL